MSVDPCFLAWVNVLEKIKKEEENRKDLAKDDKDIEKA